MQSQCPDLEQKSKSKPQEESSKAFVLSERENDSRTQDVFGDHTHPYLLTSRRFTGYRMTQVSMTNDTALSIMSVVFNHD